MRSWSACSAITQNIHINQLVKLSRWQSIAGCRKLNNAAARVLFASALLMEAPQEDEQDDVKTKRVCRSDLLAKPSSQTDPLLSEYLLGFATHFICKTSKGPCSVSILIWCHLILIFLISSIRVFALKYLILIELIHFNLFLMNLLDRPSQLSTERKCGSRGSEKPKAAINSFG